MLLVALFPPGVSAEPFFPFMLLFNFPMLNQRALEVKSQHLDLSQACQTWFLRHVTSFSLPSLCSDTSFLGFAHSFAHSKVPDRQNAFSPPWLWGAEGFCSPEHAQRMQAVLTAAGICVPALTGISPWAPILFNHFCLAK